MSKRILIVSFNTCYGGGEIYLEDIIKGLSTDGHKVYVYAKNRDRFIENITPLAIKIFIGPSREGSFLSIKNIKSYIKAVNSINTVIRKEKIDVVVLNGKDVSYLSPYLARAVSKVAIAHTFIDHPNLLLKIIILIFSTLFLNKLIFVSKRVEEQFAHYSLGLFKRKYLVIQNGVDTERFDVRGNCDKRKFVISSVGRLEHEKGVDILIRAFYKLSLLHDNVELIVAGIGRYKEDLCNLVSQLGIENKVKFVGFVKPEVVLSKTDVFVIPSRCREALSLVLLEALASGSAIIGSDVGAISEVISDNEDGLLFKSEDVDDLVSKLDKLILEPELRDKISRNGYLKAREQFSLTDTVEATINVITEA